MGFVLPLLLWSFVHCRRYSAEIVRELFQYLYPLLFPLNYYTLFMRLISVSFGIQVSNSFLTNLASIRASSLISVSMVCLATATPGYYGAN